MDKISLNKSRYIHINKKSDMKTMLSLFLMLSEAVLFAGDDHSIIKSAEDFEKKYSDKVFPFNKLSDTTFQRLKTTIVFNEENRFRGFNYVSGLRKNLTYEEYIEFNSHFGVKQVYDEEDKTDYNERRNR
jgi:hypothetical protein